MKKCGGIEINLIGFKDMEEKGMKGVREGIGTPYKVNEVRVKNSTLGERCKKIEK